MIRVIVRVRVSTCIDLRVKVIVRTRVSFGLSVGVIVRAGLTVHVLGLGLL